MSRRKFKILTIVGARPQFIKAAMFSRAVQQCADKLQEMDISEIILHTGQHYDYLMSETFFNELDIPAPAYNLGCTQPPQQMAEHIVPILKQEKPDYVVVFGDTNSTLAGAIAAHQCAIPVAHIEAGLRSHNLSMPEENNRIATDQLSSLLFCPTHQALQNLREEGITNGVHYVGDIMLDAAIVFGEIAERKATILSQLNLTPKQYILCTIHRAENTNNLTHLYNILTALAQINETIILPTHPRTAHILQEHPELQDIIAQAPHIHCIDPVGYLDMIMLERNATHILTDSGGVQKEAYFHKVPCITLRDETEWTETVAAGWNILAGTDTQRIIDACHTPFTPAPIAEYGDGHTAETILNILCLGES